MRFETVIEHAGKAASVAFEVEDQNIIPYLPTGKPRMALWNMYLKVSDSMNGNWRYPFVVPVEVYKDPKEMERALVETFTRLSAEDVWSAYAS